MAFFWYERAAGRRDVRVSGLTLLMGAAFNGRERVVDLLIRRGAEINLQSSIGSAALMLAAVEGHERVVDLLLRHGAEINLQDSGGGSALMAAAQEGHERVVSLLIRRGAEVNLQSSNGRTALMIAAVNNHSAVVRPLLQAGADATARSADGKTALQYAKEWGRAACVRVIEEVLSEAAVDALLLGQRVVLGGLSSRPELNGRRGVARSFEGGRYAVALEGGGESVRVRPGNLSPAAAAEPVSGGVVEVSNEVIAAVERGDEAVVLVWLDGGGRADASFESGEMSGLTLLMGAAQGGHLRMVELLLQHGAKINLQSRKGGTALMYAAQEGHERVLDFLLQHGADVNLQDSGGGTALIHAAFFNHPAVLLHLLRVGTDTKLRSKDGRSVGREAAPADQQCRPRVLGTQDPPGVSLPLTKANANTHGLQERKK